MRHNALQKKYKNELMTSQVLMSPNPQLMGETPPNPSTEGKCPHNILISLKHTNAQGTNDSLWEGAIKGEAPPNRGDVREGVPHKGEPLQPPTTCKASKNTEVQKSKGHMGVYTLGEYEHMGCTKCMGCTKMGVSRHPPSIKHAFH